MTTKILYVEDNPFSVSLMQLCLKKLKEYQLSVATDGKSALKMIELDKPDVILMDINLPDITGWDLSRQIRDNRETQDIPIIAVTSLNREKSKQRHQEAGINLHFNKGLNYNLLVNHMETLLNNREK